MHGFWIAAEAGLDDWAARHPADADEIAWPLRRRVVRTAGPP
jgi:heme oxygenase